LRHGQGAARKGKSVIGSRRRRRRRSCGDGYRNRLGSRRRIGCVSTVDRAQRMGSNTQRADGKHSTARGQGRGADRRTAILKRNCPGRYRGSRSWCDVCAESNCLPRDGCCRISRKGNRGCLKRGCGCVDLHRHGIRSGSTIRSVPGIGSSDAMGSSGERCNRERSCSI